MSEQKTKKVRKAVILAAGLGTRMLPIARAVPKEVLPVVDRPAISYLVEEAAKSGIEDILIITGRGKQAIEDYFDYSPEYEYRLEAKGMHGAVEDMRRICNAANVYFLRQKETKGTAHALKMARSFVGDEPFIVFYGDDIIFSEKPVCAQLIDSYEKYNRGVCAVKEVPTELVMRYCSLKTHEIDGSEKEFYVDDMIEKPSRPELIWSNYSILGRILLPADIFEIIDGLEPGVGGEYQLTDAMAVLARREGMTALDFEGKRFDLGSKLGLMCANVELAAKHPEISEDFKAFIKEFAATLL